MSTPLETNTNDSYNNNLERTGVNSFENNTNLNRDIFNDYVFNNLNSVVDLSGNVINSVFEGTSLASAFLNAIDRRRNTR